MVQSYYFVALVSKMFGILQSSTTNYLKSPIVRSTCGCKGNTYLCNCMFICGHKIAVIVAFGLCWDKHFSSQHIHSPTWRDADSLKALFSAPLGLVTIPVIANPSSLDNKPLRARYSASWRQRHFLCPFGDHWRRPASQPTTPSPHCQGVRDLLDVPMTPYHF